MCLFILQKYLNFFLKMILINLYFIFKHNSISFSNHYFYSLTSNKSWIYYSTFIDMSTIIYQNILSLFYNNHKCCRTNILFHLLLLLLVLLIPFILFYDQKIFINIQKIMILGIWFLLIIKYLKMNQLVLIHLWFIYMIIEHILSCNVFFFNRYF